MDVFNKNRISLCDGNCQIDITNDDVYMYTPDETVADLAEKYFFEKILFRAPVNNRGKCIMSFEAYGADLCKLPPYFLKMKFCIPCIANFMMRQVSSHRIIVDLIFDDDFFERRGLHD